MVAGTKADTGVCGYKTRRQGNGWRQDGEIGRREMTVK
jgi:hypothetical protein